MGVSPFAPCVIFGSLCAFLWSFATMAHLAPYISRATAFIALSHGHVIATDTCFHNTASHICRWTSARIKMKLFLPQSFSIDHRERYTRSVTELQSTSHSAMPQGRMRRLADPLPDTRFEPAFQLTDH